MWWRSIRWPLVGVCIFVCMSTGAILPAIMPARLPHEEPPIEYHICQALFFIETLFLPADSPEYVRVPANLASCSLWGLSYGVLLSLAFPRRRSRDAP